MKKITIGRGRECDIRLSDSTDKVSRRQAVITITPFGKMMIYDTSANGTFVNGEQIQKPEGKPIKRGDNVNFAHMIDLDWSLVKNPYKKSLITVAICAVIIVVLGVAFALWGDKITHYTDNSNDTVGTETTVKTDSVAKVNDSLTLEIPKETPTPTLRITPSPNRAQQAEEILKQDAEPEPEPEQPIIEEHDDPTLNEMMNKK